MPIREAGAVVASFYREAIGCIRYYDHAESNIQIGEEDAEIGYWIGKPYWNQGLGTEALRGMVDWCFNKRGFYTLWSDYFVDNPASGRIMEKSGHFFTIETFGIGAKKMYLWILNYAASLRL